MTQESFEKLIRSVGEEHNRPPAAPPLDAIWQRIEPDVRDTLQAPRPLHRTWRWQTGLAIVGALAATLVIGIGIGRTLHQDGASAVASAGSASQSDVASDAYGAVTLRHLKAANSVLTSYQKQARTGKIDPALIEEANQVLLAVEALHDSKARQDPKIKETLKLVELVLVQITSLDADSQSTDRKFVQQAMRETKIMERLRSTLPSSNVTGSL
jgi:hypothetical protein